MSRLIFVCLISLPFVLYYMWKVGYVERHSWRYSEADRYKFARRMVFIMKRNGRIRTNVYGTDNLPADGGYVMYANHQGKYDSLGIIGAHKQPCTIMMDEQRSHLLFADQFMTLLKGCRIDKTNMRSQVNAILQVIAEVKDGRKYIIFPEGGYDQNQNNVNEFLPGAFKCAIKAQSPIVPVALVDSYKPFGMNSLKPVTTQVHFLEPLYYDEYKDMTSREISNLVRQQIIDTIKEADA